ncbi:MULTISPECIES: hypothetical protein [Ponticoccus]|uniref:Uncharacterized protein n=1 Tax=Ponticoccus litoralis TaxID=422297 RepID=A0AAW9SKT9_9RHOB
MFNDNLLPRPLPDTSIESTIAQHGALRVLTASLIALFHTPTLRPPPTDVDALDDHIRRDVGLPPRRAADPRLPLSPFRY